MTAPPDDLVARLRERAEMIDEWENDSITINTLHEAADHIATLTAENKALRAAVHGLCFTNHGRRITCELCGGEFDAAEPERHAPGCLAAGAANER